MLELARYDLNPEALKEEDEAKYGKTYAEAK